MEELEDLLLQLPADKRAYVMERMNGATQSQAAKAAGRSSTSLERDPLVQQALRLWFRSHIRKTSITREDVTNGFLDAVHAAASSTELTMAWREIGKLLGYYEPEKVELSFRNVTAEKLAGMSDRELTMLAKQDGVMVEDMEVLEAQYEVLSKAIEPPEKIRREH